MLIINVTLLRIHHGLGHAAEVDALRGLIIRNNRTLKDKKYKPDS